MSDAGDSKGEEEAGGAPVADQPRVKIEPSDDDAVLTEAQVARATELFHKHDADGSGQVDKGELRSLLGELNLRLDDERFARYVDRYWTEADEDVSGLISLDEFLVLYAKVFAPNNKYGAALRQAAARGHADVVRDLVARGCNPNTGDGRGWTAVHHACEFGQLEVLTTLQDVCGLDLDIDGDDNYGWTPLYNAATNAHGEVVRALLAAGAAVNEPTKRGRTVLHCTVSCGHAAVARELLAAGADIAVQDEGGWTPLHCAALHGEDECILALLEAGADPGVTDNLGRDCVHYAGDKRTVKLIRDAVEARDAPPDTKRKR